MMSIVLMFSHIFQIVYDCSLPGCFFYQGWDIYNRDKLCDMEKPVVELVARVLETRLHCAVSQYFGMGNLF